MASLRARLVAGLLAVGAVGLLLVGGTTYAVLRTSLLDRVDAQAKTAVPFMTRDLQQPASGRRARADDGPPHGGPPAPDSSLPPGTYGEQRDASGRSYAGAEAVVFRFEGTSSGAKPKLPAQLEPGTFVTVKATTGDGRYRVYTAPAFNRSGTTVVALPLADTEQTLQQLLLVEGLVIAGVLVVLAVVALFLVRLGLRPLDRIGATADAIAAGDLSRRVSPATERTEVGRLGIALNAMLARLERAFAERQAS